MQFKMATNHEKRLTPLKTPTIASVQGQTITTESAVAPRLQDTFMPLVVWVQVDNVEWAHAHKTHKSLTPWYATISAGEV